MINWAGTVCCSLHKRPAGWNKCQLWIGALGLIGLSEYSSAGSSEQVRYLILSSFSAICGILFHISSFSAICGILFHIVLYLALLIYDCLWLKTIASLQRVKLWKQPYNYSIWPYMGHNENYVKGQGKFKAPLVGHSILHRRCEIHLKLTF